VWKYGRKISKRRDGSRRKYKDVEKSQGKCFYEPLPRTTRIKRGEAQGMIDCLTKRKKKEEILDYDDFVDRESDQRVTITTTTTTTTSG
jgi:hypothetical protein